MTGITCVSTESPHNEINFDAAILKSLPSIGGLWFPKEIKKMDDHFLNNLSKLSFLEISKQVLAHLLNDHTDLLERIIEETYNFSPKIYSINDNEHFLETFWGPTLTFKDFGARFMANYLQRKLEEEYNNSPPGIPRPHYTVLVSTSGDTGSAIASAFLNKSFFNVIILYPNNKISDMQELQITTYGKNIIAFAIDSDFDSCQRLVKQSFVDSELKEYGNFISANSINIARLIPQCLYYFYAYSRIKKQNKKLAFVVPCGNCGNLIGGLIAKQLGLQIDFFIASQNDNNTLERFVNTELYAPNDTIPTISNAMDVGDPSNLKRIRFFFKNNIDLLRENVKVMSVSQNETKSTIKFIYEKYNYLIDPHTSVAYSGYQKLVGHETISQNNTDFIFVSTAHPAKFNVTMKDIVGVNCTFPCLENLKNKTKEKYIIKNDYDGFKTLFKKLAINRGVVFIGMPGTGKSSVAKKINELYDIPYIDLDDKIETDYEMTLFEILDTFNEDGLSLIEEQAMLSINCNTTPIVSTGGSVIYSEPGMNHLKENIVIYLKTSFDILKKRTDNFSNRGIIFKGKTSRELYDERVILYEKNCDIIIDCDNYSIINIATLVANHVLCGHSKRRINDHTQET